MKPAVKTVLSKYATFSGRASRPEFWLWMLALFLLLCVTQLIDGLIIAPVMGFGLWADEAGKPLSVVVLLALILPNIAVSVRRLHDTNRRGWWVLISLVPVIGALVLVYFYIQPSDEGRNGYGDPEPFEY